MGLDYHGFCFLKRAFKDGSFGRVATMGRQNIHIRADEISRICGTGDYGYQVGDFCEELLAKEFLATVVHSFDASDYEDATFISDSNVPLRHDQDYDTVIDLGTSEHVFNVAQALRNISALCRPGGQIIHVLPADNFNGHGFWQFSPEIFFSLYSVKNGFSGTEVFMAELRDYTYWYKACSPGGGNRVEFASRSPVYVMAKTTKIGGCDDFVVQQSDYVVDWSEKNSRTSRKLPSAAAANTSPPSPRLLRSSVERRPGLSRYLKDTAFAARSAVADLRNGQYLSRNSAFTRVPIKVAIN